MWIRYVVPEDGDDILHPNVFNCKENGELVLSMIKKAFPIPGQFFFRFLKKVGDYTVWLDILDDNVAIPSYQGGIFIKATRLPTNNTVSGNPTIARVLPAPLQRADSGSKVAPPPLPAKPTRPVKPVAQETAEQLLSFHDEPAVAAAPAPATVPIPAASVQPDFFATNTPPIQQTQSSPFFEDDLLGFGSTPSTTASSSQSAATEDVFGMSTLQPTQAKPLASASSRANPLHSGLAGNNSSSSTTGNINSAFHGMNAPAVNVMGGGYGRNNNMNNMTGFGGGGGMTGGSTTAAPIGGGMNPMAKASNSFDPFSTLDGNSNKSTSSQFGRGGNTTGGSTQQRRNF